MGELERIKAELEAAKEAAKTPEDRVADQLWELRKQPKKIQIAAWARLMEEQGLDPNGRRPRYHVYKKTLFDNVLEGISNGIVDATNVGRYTDFGKSWIYKKALIPWSD